MQPAILLTVLLIASGTLLFGGVYPWVYWPLAVGCLSIFALTLLRRPFVAARTPRRLLVWIGVAWVVIALQLLPLPTGVVEWIAPGRTFFLGDQTAFQAGPWTQLSLSAAATAQALAWVIALSMLLLALVEVVAVKEAEILTVAVALLGCLIAVIGLGQEGNSIIYGIWQPFGTNAVFGPFVNRNHFAGWVVIAIGMTGGLCAARLAECRRLAEPGWHGWLRAFASREGCQVALLASAVVLMVVSVGATYSRSGLLAIAAVAVSFLVFAARSVSTGTLAKAVALPVALLVAVLFLTLDVGALGRHLMQARSALGLRAAVWRQALSIVPVFPATGTGLGTFQLAFPRFLNGAPDGFLQAHNDYVQLLVEGGLLLAAALLGVAVSFVRQVRLGFAEVDSDRSFWIRVGAVAGLVGIAVQESVEFSLRAPAVAVLFVACCAVAAQRKNVDSL